ncbi:MAG: type II toxin-antitoxin system VapC family toxin [Spirochaeta sp.]
MILLDTCVVSESLKPDPAEAVLRWISVVPEQRVYLSVFVLAELQKGIEKLDTGRKQAALRIWFEQLQDRFKDRILDFDAETALAWGRMIANLEYKGVKLPLMDSLLAAQASHRDFILATRNTDDFKASGIQLVNPWEGHQTPL